MPVRTLPQTTYSTSENNIFPRLRWTRADCRFLEKSGLLEFAYELIEGDIVPKVKNQPHVISTKYLTIWLNRIFGELFVSAQEPISLAGADKEYNYLEPDAVVLLEPVVSYTTSAPGPSDVCLLVEVTHSTRRRDLITKPALYARAGFAEYWVLDIANRQLIVHRDPQPQMSAYQSVTIVDEDGMVAPLGNPDAVVRVADLLPPAGITDSEDDAEG